VHCHGAFPNQLSQISRQHLFADVCLSSIRGLPDQARQQSTTATQDRGQSVRAPLHRQAQRGEGIRFQTDRVDLGGPSWGVRLGLQQADQYGARRLIEEITEA
jgi:hypothetical protein